MTSWLWRWTSKVQNMICCRSWSTREPFVWWMSSFSNAITIGGNTVALWGLQNTTEPIKIVSFCFNLYAKTACLSISGGDQSTPTRWWLCTPKWHFFAKQVYGFLYYRSGTSATESTYNFFSRFFFFFSKASSIIGRREYSERKLVVLEYRDLNLAYIHITRALKCQRWRRCKSFFHCSKEIILFCILKDIVERSSKTWTWNRSNPKLFSSRRILFLHRCDIFSNH